MSNNNSIANKPIMAMKKFIHSSSRFVSRIHSNLSDRRESIDKSNSSSIAENPSIPVCLHYFQIRCLLIECTVVGFR